jgi:hypothetical protein
MAQCKKTTAKCAKKTPADLKAVKPAAADKVKGGMSKGETPASKELIRRRFS